MFTKTAPPPKAPDLKEGATLLEFEKHRVDDEGKVKLEVELAEVRGKRSQAAELASVSSKALKDAAWRLTTEGGGTATARQVTADPAVAENESRRLAREELVLIEALKQQMVLWHRSRREAVAFLLKKYDVLERYGAKLNRIARAAAAFDEACKEEQEFFRLVEAADLPLARCGWPHPPGPAKPPEGDGPTLLSLWLESCKEAGFKVTP